MKCIAGKHHNCRRLNFLALEHSHTGCRELLGIAQGARVLGLGALAEVLFFLGLISPILVAFLAGYIPMRNEMKRLFAADIY